MYVPEHFRVEDRATAIAFMRANPFAILVSTTNDGPFATHIPVVIRETAGQPIIRGHVAKANPHRFRHTFATDMIRAGISLPALMHLMGHAQIQTTMVYVCITPQDVYQQYAHAVAQLVRPPPPSHS